MLEGPALEDTVLDGSTLDGSTLDDAELAGPALDSWVLEAPTCEWLLTGLGADTGARRADTGWGASSRSKPASAEPASVEEARARLVTTVGRIRSSTCFWPLCRSRCRFTRSICSGSTALMWLRTSVTPTDWNNATSDLLSIARSRATS
jgi:hypothetical protein